MSATRRAMDARARVRRRRARADASPPVGPLEGLGDES